MKPIAQNRLASNDCTLAAMSFLLFAAALLTFFATPAQAQELRVQHDSTELYNGGRFDFGPTAVGRPVRRELVIRNLGDRDLLVSSVQVPEGFNMLRQPSTRIPPRGSSNFIVELTARSFGKFSGLLTFQHNARNASAPFELTVLGNSGPVATPAARRPARAGPRSGYRTASRRSPTAATSISGPPTPGGR